MAVTKTSFVFILVVLAITYNQGAARSVYSGNGLSSSDELQGDSGGEKVFAIPTVLKEGLEITINNTVDTTALKFVLELTSRSGETNCQITYIYGEHFISISPAVEGYENMEYYLDVTSGVPEQQKFLLTMKPRTVDNNNMIVMTFYNTIIGTSSQLICTVENFEDINQIAIKEGVAHVNSLLFEFE